MSKLKYLILCTLLCVVFLGTACASDDLNQTDDVGLAEGELGLETANGTGTFEDIQDEIDAADEGATIDLSGNFKSTGSEIRINKSLTINGHQKTTIDAGGMSGLFYLDNVSRLSVSGVTFVNCEFYGDPVERWNNGYAGQYSFTDCVFRDNTGFFLQISSQKATFTGCNFTGNHIDLSMLDSDDLTVKNCRFSKNTDQLIERAKTIDGCVFEKNYAYCFDLIGSAESIKNSRFTGNYYMGSNIVINSVKSMYNNYFEANDCADHIIKSAGTVDKCIFKANLATIFSKFVVLKNSRFENNRGDISANGGSVSGCRFTGGKGIDKYLAASSITNSHFKNIKSCYIQGGKLSVKGCDFTNVKGYLSASKVDRCSFSKSDMDVLADSISNSRFTKNNFHRTEIKAKTIKKCQFVQNKCQYGIVSVKKISNSKFVKNVCKCGLVYASKAAINCRFEKNSFSKSYESSLFGGTKLVRKCVFISNTGKLGTLVTDVNTIDGCTFKNNKITDCGEGLVSHAKKVLNSKFTNNRVSRAIGGAIDYVKVVKKCTFKKNYALAGGAIHTVGKFTIEKCVFEKNTVKHSGSAIFLNTPYKTRINGIIKSCKFIKNKSKGKINSYGTPFKTYKKGTVFALGDPKLKIKLRIKKCRGL